MKIKLLMLVAAALLPTTLFAQLSSNWAVNLRSDPMTDEKEGGAMFFGTNGSRLLIACNGIVEKTLSVQYLPKGYLGSSDNVVMIRFDNDPPLPATVWTYAKDGAYTVSPAYVDAFSSRVGSGATLIKVRALNYEDQPIDAAFGSNNGLAAINQIREACGKPAL